MNDETKITIKQIKDVLNEISTKYSNDRIKVYVECKIDETSGQYKSTFLEQLDRAIKERITK